MIPEAALETLGEQIDIVFFVIGVIILLIELAEAFFKGDLKGRKIGEMLVSASTQLPFIAVEVTIMTAGYVAFYILAYTAVPWQLPLTWWSAVLAVFVADFFYYWEHRIAHQVRILWTQHAVHHSSRDFNIITGIRFGPLEGVWSLIAHIPMLFLGFPPELVFFGAIVGLAYQTWIHTETIGKLGWFEEVFNTPSHHRVHHGSEPEYVDRNYGAILIVWDRLFGTYAVEKQTPRYGLVRDFDSRNPVKVWFSELPQLGRDLASAKSIGDVFGYLFSRPGWAPKVHRDERR